MRVTWIEAMRPAEIALCCLLFIAAVVLTGGWAVSPAIAAAFLLLLVGAVLIHLISEGAHWQVIPLYLAGVAVAPWWISTAHTSASIWSRLCGSAGIVMVLTVIVLSWVLPMFRLPKPTGPYAVGTRIVHMVDAKRDAEGGPRTKGQRELMVQLWYPAERVKAKHEVYRRRSETTRKSAYQSVLRTDSLRDVPVLQSSMPHPVLIFNPAWTGQRTQSTFLMQELASHGYVVASVDHTYYSGLVQFPDGRVLDGHMAPALGDFTYLSIAEGIELANQFVTILAEDVIFVLDELAAWNDDAKSEWHGRLDLQRVATLGHSIGGAAAAEACLMDARIRAALNLDGWTFGEVLLRGLAKPWMVVYGKGMEIEPADLAAQPEGMQRYWQMNRENAAAVEEFLRRSGGYCVSIQGASHWNFSDRPLYSPLRSQTQAGTIDATRAHRIMAELALAFFRETLRDESKGSVRAVVDQYKEAAIRN